MAGVYTEGAMFRKTAVGVAALVFVVLAEARVGRWERRDEASAIGSLAAINKVQSEYAARTGAAGYAGSLAALARPCPGETGAPLSPDLASDPAVKSGYRISLVPTPGAHRVSSDCNGAATYSGYYATAAPISRSARRRAFASDETANVWFDVTGVPPSPPFTGPVLH